MNNGYAFKFLIAIDIFVCSIVWRDPDITISSMCGLELRKPAPRWWARWLGGALNKIQTNHCESAIGGDQTRALAALKILGQTWKP